MSAIRFILHGKGAQKKGVHAAVKAVRDTGRTVEVRVTFEAGDAAAFARQAVEDARNGTVATIVAGGGDGTINEVFGAAIEADAPASCSFAIVPLGTANDFARSVGVPADDPLTALTIAARDTIRPIDIGRFNGRPFFNMVTGGFGSRVTVETDPEFKRRLGGLAYILTGISRFRDLSSSRGRFRAEGFEWEGAFIAIAIGNGRQAGGGIPLCPDALLDDGKLELTIVPELAGDERKKCSDRVFSTRHAGRAGCHDENCPQHVDRVRRRRTAVRQPRRRTGNDERVSGGMRTVPLSVACGGRGTGVCGGMIEFSYSVAR